MQVSNSTTDLVDVTNVITAKDLIHETWDIIEKRKSTGIDFPINFLPTVKDKIKGFSRGELVIVGARPSNGKSAFSLSLAIDLAKQGKKVHFFSLEMTRHSCMERIMANVGKIDSMDMLDGSCLDYANIQDKQSAIYDTLNNIDFTFSDSIGKTFKEIDFIVQNLKGIDIVFLDYIQMVKGISGKHKDDIDEYIKGLRNLAITKDICVVICSQVNRSGANTGIPQIHEMKGTGCLEEVADKVVLLHWQWFYDNDHDKAEYAIRVAKNRVGQTGTFKVQFQPEYSLITDVVAVRKEYGPNKRARAREVSGTPSPSISFEGADTHRLQTPK